MSDAVSLTMGNSVFPFGYGLAAHAKRLSLELLRHLAAGAVGLQRLTQGALHGLLFLPHLLAADVLLQRPYDQHKQINHRGHQRRKNQNIERRHPCCKQHFSFLLHGFFCSQYTKPRCFTPSTIVYIFAYITKNGLSASFPQTGRLI